jgi:hypothetical protein
LNCTVMNGTTFMIGCPKVHHGVLWGHRVTMGCEIWTMIDA